METNKTVSIVIEETKGAFVNVINSSGLPLSIIKLVLDNISNQVNVAAANELKQDIKKYQEATKEQANEEAEVVDPKEEIND